MLKDDPWPIIILLGIIAIALFGGVKNANKTSGGSQNDIPSPSERQLSKEEIAYRTQNAQYQVDQLKQKLADEQEAKISSQYKGQITTSWGNYGVNDPNQEYIEIDANYNNSQPIKINGWQLVSNTSGTRIIIPQSTNLYFANSNNSDEDVWLWPGEKAYIISGRSPIGYGIHANICSGYLSQFNTFTPNLYTQCPLAHEEDLSSIPRSPVNNNCFDLIDSYPMCTVRTQALDNTYSYQCQNFVSTKLNYQSCVDTHKNDANFYSPKTWYIYLKHDSLIWQTKREAVTLYDSAGKKVYSITH